MTKQSQKEMAVVDSRRAPPPRLFPAQPLGGRITLRLLRLLGESLASDLTQARNQTLVQRLGSEEWVTRLPGQPRKEPLRLAAFQAEQRQQEMDALETRGGKLLPGLPGQVQSAQGALLERWLRADRQWRDTRPAGQRVRTRCTQVDGREAARLARQESSLF